MILVLLIIIGVASIVVTKKYRDGLTTEISMISSAICIATFCVLLVLIIVTIINYIDAPMTVLKMDEWRESIEYEMDSFTVDDDPIELIHDIRDYNSAIEQGVYWQNNFWVGIMHPNIYHTNNLIAYEGVLE